MEVNKALIDEITKMVLQELVRRSGKNSFQETFSACSVCTNDGHCAERRAEVCEQFLTNGAARISASPGIKNVSKNLASTIDHTLLKPDATKDQITDLCFEAKKYGFASVCINPYYVNLAAKILAGTSVRVCTVIGFPLGAAMPETKAFETRTALVHGASEVDMVINIGALKSGDLELVEKDVRSVVRATTSDVIVKVIIETCLLSDEEKVKACLIAKVSGADYVKTSTGFSGGGATLEDISLMRRVVGEAMGVKASGGIRDYDTAMKMVKAGASRIGASASVRIIQEAKR